MLLAALAVVDGVLALPYRLRDVVRDDVERIFGLLAPHGQFAPVFGYADLPCGFPAPDVDEDAVAARLLAEVVPLGVVSEELGHILRRGVITRHLVHVVCAELLVAVLDAAVGPLHLLAVDREDRIAVRPGIRSQHLEVVGSRAPP